MAEDIEIDIATCLLCDTLEDVIQRGPWCFILLKMDPKIRYKRMRKLVQRWHKEGIDITDNEKLVAQLMTTIINKYEKK